MTTPKPLPSNPSSYPRRVLLCTLGLTPQVLTETVYALGVMIDPAFLPTEIHVVSTSSGALMAREALMRPGRAMLAALAGEYALEGVRAALTEDRIHVIADGQGHAYADIDSQDASSATADLLTDLIRRFTVDDEAAVHVSIAGGRKTMGFLGGYALSLFGRAQDRLSHVLVSAPFETHRDFYYPPREPRDLFDRDNRPANTADAVVRLAYAPFIPMGARLPKVLRDTRMSFSDAVTAHKALMEPPQLVIDYASLTATCQGRPVRLAARELAFLGWLARRVLEHGTYAARTKFDGTVIEEFLEEYRRCLPDELSRDEDFEKLRKATEIDHQNYFNQRKAMLKAALEKELSFLADQYVVPTRRGKPSGLDLPPEAIRFVGEEARDD